MPRARTPKPSANQLPGVFQPYLWERNTDGRSVVARTIKARFKRLCKEAGCDTLAKEMLAQRIAFVSVQLETMEVQAAHTKQFDAGSYTALTNMYHGLLKALGLDLNKKSTKSILSYQQDDDS